MNTESLNEAWKGLNIKKRSIPTNPKNARRGNDHRKLKNPNVKYCKYCKDTVCSIAQVVLGYPIVKKKKHKLKDMTTYANKFTIQFIGNTKNLIIMYGRMIYNQLIED